MKLKKGKKVKNKAAKSATKHNKNLADITTDEFFEQGFTSDIDDIDQFEREVADNQRQQNEDSDSGESNMDPVEHKKSLQKLKDTDPEFYKYLKVNDKNLLEFDLSDDGEDASDDEESDGRHIPSENLEVASDESDYEAKDSTEASSSNKITLATLRNWQDEIQKDKSSKTIKCAIEAFHAALQSIDTSEDRKPSQFKVEGSAVFNGVMQLCVLYLADAVQRFLKLSNEKNVEIHKCKRFTKVKTALKTYLSDLIKVLQNVSSSNIQSILLKHLHRMLPYTNPFSSLTKPLLRILLKLWATGEETVRVVAFLCILRIATSHHESILETLLKVMYVKYVENAKFVSPTTLPGINFMRRSLTEIYLLEPNLSYTHAFLYIRQLAIHLRNAVTLKKKEHFQAVYNWQYINSLSFWSELMCRSRSDSMLRSLLYPLVQITIGTIKVIPTTQYYPLRFHCVQMLTNISKDTDTFIPTLPFLLEILSSYDFNKRHKAVSMKPISLLCILRVSKSQMQENGFKDSVMDTIYQLILENAAKDSHKIYFSDLYIPCIIQLKAFLKKCHVANYCRKMKQLLDKIEENRKFIEKERQKVTFGLKDMPEIINWENRIKTQGTSLAKFYESWIKIHQSQKLKLLTKNDEVAEYNLPTIKKTKKRQSEDNSEDGSDESDESELDLRIKGTGDKAQSESEKSKSKVKKKRKKNAKSDSTVEEDELPIGDADTVQDTNVEDWD